MVLHPFPVLYNSFKSTQLQRKNIHMAIVIHVQRSLPRGEDQMSKILLQQPSSIKFERPAVSTAFWAPFQTNWVVIRYIRWGSPSPIEGKAREKWFR